MGLFDIFKQKANQPKNDDMVLPWINAEDNPWKVRLLDLRPFTQTMVSTSADPRMAENAISYGGEDGSSFFGVRPQKTKTVDSRITLPIDGVLHAGVLFIPNTMEQKWAIYFDGENLIFVRSWLREVFVVAKTRQSGNRLIVETITGEFTQDETPAFTNAVLNYLLISHSLGEVVPAPLPGEFKDIADKVGYWAFSAYGKMAQIGIFDDSFVPTTNSPLRTHSLLHIAVARGDIDAIDRLAHETRSLDYLAGDGLAPLHWSIASLATVPMEKLLALGANPDVRSDEGATPLMNAAQSNKPDQLKVLIRAGANVNAIDNRGFTALHRACEMGHREIAKLLLDHGADKSIVAEGHTALSLAQMRDQKEMIDLLNN